MLSKVVSWSSQTDSHTDRMTTLPSVEDLSTNLVDKHNDKSGQLSHELPSILPLSHQNSFLKPDEEFDIDAFLLSRAAHTSLPELRSELRDYLADLKAELVQLLNDDYESFISLSTDLRSEGPRLQRMKQPLDGVKAEILSSKTQLLHVKCSIEGKLAERDVLREEKTLLHLLLRISDSISRLEELISGYSVVPSPASGQTPSGGLIQVKHISRVASEYVQLLYLIRRAEAENCILVETLAPRLNGIKETLISVLDRFFANTLRAKPISEQDRAKHFSDLNECLKIYDDLHLYREAERVLEAEIMLEFVKKAIHSSALTLPPSPVIPHTPLEPSKTPNPHFNSLQLPPSTPFTPFPAPLLKLDEVPDTTLPNFGDHPLGQFYTTVLRFIDREIKPFIAMSENLNVRHQDNLGEGNRFDILTNVVWDQVGRAIMDELGNAIFAIGRPDEFQRNYVITSLFLSALESMSPSLQTIITFRNHPISQAFEKRWQLNVYFQLRWKEIVTNVDESLALSLGRLEQRSLEFPEAKEFASNQALAAYKAVRCCWSQDVYLHELGWRFWRLTLQILERFKLWTSQVILQLDPQRVIQSKTMNINSRTATPEPTAVDLGKETMLLRQAAVIITDSLALDKHLRRLWVDQISILLPQPENSAPSLEDVLLGFLSKQKSTVEPLAGIINCILSRRAREAVSPLRQLPSQFRAMSGKRAPTRPSEYVTGIMKPVRLFFGIGAAGDHQGAQLREAYSTAWATEVFESAVEEFASHYKAMRKNEELLRRLKKGKKSAFSLFSSTSSAASSDDLVDEDRVRAQVLLDVDALGKDAASIGVAVDQCDVYQNLRSLAQSKFEDVS